LNFAVKINRKDHKGGTENTKAKYYFVDMANKILLIQPLSELKTMLYTIAQSFYSPIAAIQNAADSHQWIGFIAFFG